jgi:hypothetical protein
MAFSVRLASAAACAKWLHEGLRSWGYEQGTAVGSIVPPEFEAFARIRKAEEDTLSLDQASRLARLLDGQDPAGTMYFAVWEGYGGLAQVIPPNAPKLEMPQRTYFLFQGQPSDIGFDWHRDGYYFAPDIWWPGHRRWCVGSDPDLGHAYVGGSPTVIAALLSDPDLRADPTEADYRIDLDPEAGV